MKDSVYTVILEAFTTHRNPYALPTSNASLNQITKQFWKDATFADVEIILTNLYTLSGRRGRQQEFDSLIHEWHNSSDSYTKVLESDTTSDNMIEPKNNYKISITVSKQ